nr:MAG TPA: hypothetical protein [Caudoviricetes sp.]
MTSSRGTRRPPRISGYFTGSMFTVITGCLS